MLMTLAKQAVRSALKPLGLEPRQAARLALRPFGLELRQNQIVRCVRPYIKRYNTEGVTFDFLIGDHEGRYWYDLHYTGVWKEMAFIRDRMLSSGDTVLECGAHHGFATILFANWVGPNGRVIAFDPMSHNCGILQKNISLNRLANIAVQQKAVGARAGYALFANTSNAYASTEMAPELTASGDVVKVEITTLDEYADLRPNFIKIDVEGYEQQVLDGARSVLALRPKLAIELHSELLPRYGASSRSVVDRLSTGGYELWIQWQDDAPPEPYRGQAITGRVHLFCFPRS